MCICICVHMCIYIYIYIYIYIFRRICAGGGSQRSWKTTFREANRGTRWHTRNRHLRNHRGSPVAFSNGCSFQHVCNFLAVFPKGFALSQWIFTGIVQRIQWHFPMKLHLLNFRCAIFCPDQRLLVLPTIYNIYIYTYIILYPCVIYL